MKEYIYQKSDLIYKYNAKAKDSHDNPKITGKIDRDKFNRHEEYEVLDFINSFSKENKLSREDCIKMEHLIHHKLPKDIIKREEVKKWFDENINKYTLKK